MIELTSINGKYAFYTKCAHCTGGASSGLPQSASAQAANGLAVLGSSFGTKGSLTFLTHLATSGAASQTLVEDVLESVVTLEQV